MLPEQIALFREFFSGRIDDFAEQHHRIGEENPVFYTPTRRELQDQDIVDHLNGEHTYGVYLIKSGEDVCHHTIIDVDILNPDILKRVVGACHKVGLTKECLLIEFSGSKGYHIIVRHKDAIPAMKARALGHLIVRLSGEERYIEVFPKQDKVEVGGYGNLIKLPLGKHKLTGYWSYFLDADLKHIDDWIGHLKGIQRLDEKGLDSIMATNHSVPIKVESEVKPKKMNYAPCVKKIMELGVGEGCRNEAMLEVAKDCYRQAYPQEVALAVLLECNSKNRPPISDTELSGIVQSVYAKGYTGVSCDKGFLQEHCVKDDCYVSRKLESNVSVADIRNYDVADCPKPTTSASLSKERVLMLDHLPEGFIKEYAKFSYPLTEAPIQYHIATGLVIAATVLGRRIYLREGLSIYYPNLYMIIYGSSGIARKSTAINLCQRFLNRINPNFMLSGNMMSMEALLDAYRLSNVHMILYDEFRNLLVNEDKSYGKGLIATFTSLWQCPQTWRMDIKKLPLDQRILTEPVLNILAATTPDWLAIKEGDILGGFMGRFLPVYADERDQRRLAFRPPIDDEKEEELIKLLTALNLVSGEYTWAEDAKEYVKGIYDSLHNAFANEPNKAFIQPYWSRIDTHIRKLAMLFDACSAKPTFILTKDNIIKAQKVMEFITDCYREMLKRVTFSLQDKKEQQFLEMLEKAYPKWVTHSAIMHTLHLSAELMKRVATSLDEKELIEAKDVAQGTKKPRRLYRLRK